MRTTLFKIARRVQSATTTPLVHNVRNGPAMLQLVASKNIQRNIIIGDNNTSDSVEPNNVAKTGNKKIKRMRTLFQIRRRKNPMKKFKKLGHLSH